jgi:hypothetical protein
MTGRAAALLIFSVLGLGGPSTGGAEQVADEMFGVRWGMTPKQVGQHYRLQPLSGGRWVAYERVIGRDTTISFVFFQGRLAHLEIEYLQPDFRTADPHGENEYFKILRWSDRIKKMLRIRYGEPSPGAWNGELRWRRSDTEINLRRSFGVLIYDQISTVQARKDAAAAESERRDRAEAKQF